jgi:serine/threonine protein phosphatase PrpC
MMDSGARDWSAPVEEVLSGEADGVAHRAAVAALSDRGLRRENNEDALLVVPSAGLVAIADGMGGHSCGDRASRVALEGLEEFFLVPDGEEGVTWPMATMTDADATLSRLVSGIQYADHKIKAQKAAAPQCRDMGTTIVAVLLDGGRVHLAHVGDSRAYRLRRGTFTCLTRDHSLANDPSMSGVPWLSEEEKRRRVGHILTRCLGVGTERRVQVTRITLILEPGDRFLLCTDGLSDLVEEDEIKGILSAGEEPLVACRALIDQANQRGGRDNITVALMDIQDITRRAVSDGGGFG